MALFLSEAKISEEPVEIDMNALAVEATEAIVETVTMIGELREAGILAEIALMKTENLSESAVGDFVKRVVEQIKVIIGKVWANIKNIARKVYRWADWIVRTLLGRMGASSFTGVPSGIANYYKQMPALLERGLKLIESPTDKIDALKAEIKKVGDEFDALNEAHQKAFTGGKDFLGNEETQKGSDKLMVSTLDNGVKFVTGLMKTIEAAEAKMTAEAEKIKNDDQAQAVKAVLLEKISFASKLTQYAVKSTVTIKMDFGWFGSRPHASANLKQHEEKKS